MRWEQQYYLLMVKEDLAIVAHVLRILGRVHLGAHWSGGNMVVRLHLHLLKLLLIVGIGMVWLHGMLIGNAIVARAHGQINLILSGKVDVGVGVSKAQAAHRSV